jgi:hypothetical protein
MKQLQNSIETRTQVEIAFGAKTVLGGLCALVAF